MTGKLIWTGLLATLLLMIPAGCSSRDDDRIIFKLYWIPQPQFGGFYEAQRSGSFERRGLNVEIVPGNVGAPSLDMVAAGTATFGLSTADEVVRARAIGKPVVAIFAVYQSNPQAIMTPAARGIERFEQIFESGTLAIETGKAFSDFLKARYGYDRLTLTGSPFGNLTRFRTETDYAMQCYLTEEPILARRLGVEPTVFPISLSGFDPYAGVVIVREQTLNERPELVGRFLEAIIEGWTDYLRDPAPANELMHRLNPDMDLETFAESAALQVPLIRTAETERLGIGAMTRERWQLIAEQLREIGQIQQIPDLDAAFRWSPRN